MIIKQLQNIGRAYLQTDVHVSNGLSIEHISNIYDIIRSRVFLPENWWRRISRELESISFKYYHAIFILFCFCFCELTFPWPAAASGAIRRSGGAVLGKEVSPANVPSFVLWVLSGGKHKPPNRYYDD